MKKVCSPSIYPLLITFLSVFLFFSSAEAAITFRDGKVVDADLVPTLSLEEHFQAGKAALESGDSEEAAKQFYIVTQGFPDSAETAEGYYYLGVAYFQEEDFDFANDSFSQYLQRQTTATKFEEALKYKFSIAEKFREGAKKHMFNSDYFPKWMPARELAIEIYNEIIAAVPGHELAVQSMFEKAHLLWQMQDGKQSIETLQLLTRRFPTHEYAPQAFLNINRIYYEQSKTEFQNPDIISLAQINCRKFAIAFPKDSRVQQAEAFVMRIKETYAWGLFDTAQFYERKSCPEASVIYYRNALAQFPDTSVAKLCKQRLSALEKNEKQG